MADPTTAAVLVLVEDEQFGYDSAGGGPVMQDYVYDLRTSELRKFVGTKPLDPAQVVLHAQPWRRLHELDKNVIVAAINVEFEKERAAFVRRRLGDGDSKCA